MAAGGTIRDLGGQAARFAVVGGLAATLDFAILGIIVEAGGSRYAGRIVSVAIGLVFTWALNRRLTFATPAPPTWGEFARYAAVAMTGIALNLTVYWLTLGAGMPLWLAFALGTGLAAVFNFFRYRALLDTPAPV